jgi:hypothetical protein
MLAKFHQILRFWKFSVNFYRNSTHRNFPEFWFESYFETGENSIRKVVPYPKLFLSIFYLELWSLVSPPFDQISLNSFELI